MPSFLKQVMGKKIAVIKAVSKRQRVGACEGKKCIAEKKGVIIDR